MDDSVRTRLRVPLHDQDGDQGEPIPLSAVPGRSIGAMMPTDLQNPDPPPETYFDDGDRDLELETVRTGVSPEWSGGGGAAVERESNFN
jgi:hypothetical protein